MKNMGQQVTESQIASFIASLGLSEKCREIRMPWYRGNDGHVFNCGHAMVLFADFEAAMRFIDQAHEHRGPLGRHGKQPIDVSWAVESVGMGCGGGATIS